MSLKNHRNIINQYYSDSYANAKRNDSTIKHIIGYKYVVQKNPNETCNNKSFVLKNLWFYTRNIF